MNPKVLESNLVFAVKSIATQVNTIIEDNKLRHRNNSVLKYLYLKVPRIVVSYGNFDSTTPHYSITIYVEVADPLKPLFDISPLVHVHGEDLSTVLETLKLRVDEMIQGLDKAVEQAKETANKTIKAIESL